jgi:type I restriction system adenine methylase HsdM
MAIKKSELYSSLWQSCDELRGGMDASQYKDYVLVLLFVKYVSDKYAGQPFAPITIPAGASFKDMVALKGKSDIGDQINKKILGPLANANKLSDMPDFNDATKLGTGKEMVDRLTNLIAIFENPSLDFSKNRAEGDDILGDAYEYLMRHFATESGKSKGQFYTPAEVSRIMAKILGIASAKTSADTTVYDPTCGSGSLLLKVADAAKAKVTLYGQEKDAATSGLARMNMILHDNPTALVKQGNTLTNPLFTDSSGQLKTFDYVVANPPFSDKRWSTGLDPANDPHERFKHYGTPPAKQGDYAYLLHILRSLKSTGKGACILPHGVLFRGNAEGVIRKNLIQRGFIKGIIGLPANLFYGTGIPACILMLDKEHAAARKGIFMIDASKGFIKDGPKNRLREQDIHRIVDTFTRQVDIPGYARMVPVAEISDAKNDFNLNLPRYIDSSEPEDLQDIDGHLRGGIPERDLSDPSSPLAKCWQVLPSLRAELFASVVEEKIVLPKDMCPDYAETHFCSPEHAGWPKEFVILTGFATTGKQWTEEQNRDQNEALEAELRLLGTLPRPITGYSPKTLHAEPSWAVQLDFAAACDLGTRFHQDALYLVREGILYVSHCDQRRKLIRIGPFFPRLHLSTNKPLVRPGYAALRIPLTGVRAAILGHPEFTAFNQAVIQRFTEWRQAATREILAFEKGGHPKALIETIAEALLAAFHQAPLLDAYDIYQHLMDYWAETMQDDAYLIAADGWVAKTARLIETDKKGKQKDKGWACDLVPKALIVARYYAKEQAALDAKQAELEVTSASLVELEEEHGGEEGYLGTLEKIAKAEINARLKETKGDREAKDEALVLKRWLDLSEGEAALKREVKALDAALDTLAYEKYPQLSEAEIKAPVVDDKWMARLSDAVQGELDRISQTLTSRIRELAERYSAPLPQIIDEVQALAARVDGHLARMGRLQ